MESMNHIINRIICDYEYENFVIENAFMDIAMEAESETSGDTNSTPENSLQEKNKITLQLKKIIQTISGIIERAILKLSNTINQVFQTDKGFSDNFHKAMVKNKSLEAIKLVTYDYDDQALDSHLQKLASTVMKQMEKIQNTDTNYGNASSENQPKDPTVEDVLKEMGLPGEVTNMNSYFIYLKNLYRREKKEFLFKSSLTQEYAREASGITKTKNIVKNRQSELKSRTEQLKSNLKSIANSPETGNEIKKRVLARQKNIIELYNFYTHTLDLYTQLKIEKIFTYRIVLKKLWQFN